MKTLKTIISVICTIMTLSACSEDTFSGLGGSKGEPVELSLGCKSSKSTDIVVTRANGDAAYNESKLQTLQVFVFDADTKKLKGYKFIDGADKLSQNGETGVVKIKTTTGPCYIYAVANVSTGKGSYYQDAEDKKNLLPTDLEEAKAWAGGGDDYEINVQNGVKSFTLDDLKKIAFKRESKIFDITDLFLMSGSVNNGQACTISKTSNGFATVTGADPLISLHRIVAKVTFNIKVAEPTGNVISRTFEPTSYDIYNIPIEGSLIEDNGEEALKPKTFENLTGATYSAQDGGNTFERYLPENLQDTNIPNGGTGITKYEDREKDTGKGNDKTFVNAPEHGTYAVLYGNYSEIKSVGNNEERRDATVKYYVHLGDFRNNNIKEFDIHRNYHYTYNVTVEGVEKIVVQVTSENGADPQPGAEGTVLDYTTGKTYIVDSHYGQVDMTFSQASIKALVDAPTNTDKVGYRLQVHELNHKSDVLYLDKNGWKGNLNNATLDWVKFAQGKNQDYGTSFKDQKLIGAKEMLEELYNNRNNDAFWNEAERTITYTCFVDENYYPNLKWGEYTNIAPRTLFIADEAKSSPDGRSVYAKVAYGLSQHSIKTFYNSEYDGSTSKGNIVAYGLETIRDDWHGDKEPTDKSNGNGKDRWNGLANMKQDVKPKSQWSAIDYNKFREACMSRNRDLNGDGVIDDDEIRWYCPATDQYAGMWIGENAIDDINARLFNGKTTELKDNHGQDNRTNGEHYYTNTNSLRTFWAEEGMATGSREGTALKFIRCIRNLQSISKGTNVEPDKYYETNGNTVNLDRINPKALRQSYQTEELGKHKERGSDTDRATSNAKNKFTIANTNSTETDLFKAANDDKTVCSRYKEGNGTWRAPNQRELCLIYMLRKYQNVVTCRTTFSGTIRTYWGTNNNLLMMYANSQKAYIRCVKDEK